MLAVVEHEQRRPVADVVGEQLDRPAARLRGHADRRQHRTRHRARIADRRQLDPPHPAVEPFDRLGGHLQPQPSLADTTRSDQRHQPATTDRRHHRRRLGLATDQRGQARRQVVPERIKRTQRREVVLEIGVTQLPHPLGAAEILQAVGAEIAERGAGWHVISDDEARRIRHEHLAAVANRPQPSASADRRAELIELVTELGPAGVDGHANTAPRRRPAHAARPTPPQQQRSPS